MPSFATALAHGLSSNNFRAYTSTDIVGVEVGGAVKNVLAVGAGLSDGLGFGANTRIALITRGLVEMTRLGVTLGAQRETFMGLAGLGDLVLTCTDDQSRNRRFGLLLAAGKTPEQALAEIGQAVEGYLAAKAVHHVAQRAGVDMPICTGIYRVLYENLPAKDLVRGLMSRPIKSEHEVELSAASPRARKAVLAPRLVDDERHRVRQVQAAVRRAASESSGAARAARAPALSARQALCSEPKMNASPGLERHFAVGVRAAWSRRRKAARCRAPRSTRRCPRACARRPARRSRGRRGARPSG